MPMVRCDNQVSPLHDAQHRADLRCPSDDKKSKRSESPAVKDKDKDKDKDKENASLGSPLVNIIDDAARETFITGRPLEDSLNLQQCKHCKKGIIKTAAKAHIAQCLKIKKEKAQRKKEAREARERAKEQAREEEARKNDPDGDTKMNDDSDDDDDNADKKDKASKKVGGKKPDGEPKGKKRKADGDGDKGPKSKKKKEEKPKAPKPKGVPISLLNPSRTCRMVLRSSHVLHR